MRLPVHQAGLDRRHPGVGDPLDVPVAHLAFEQALGVSHAIQSHFRTGEAPYSFARTLLATGVLEAAVESRFRGAMPIDTPHLEIAYRPKFYQRRVSL